jgi:pimeloyl-ACP methyl ester carboxylesterase
MLRALPACDAAVIERGDIQAAVRRDLVRPLASTTACAAIQDLRLERSPWGFRLHDIEGPIHIWHGDLDQNVDVASGIYQANEITQATLHRLPDAGHWLVYSHFEDIVQHLTPTLP